VSLMVSLTDVGVLTGIKDYFNAAHRMWLDVVERKMYIMGGIGSTATKGSDRRTRFRTFPPIPKRARC